MIAEEGDCCPSLCDSLARPPLCLLPSRAPMVPAVCAHYPVFLHSPSISGQPILSMVSQEDWGALHGVQSCQRRKEGAPAPRSMQAGAQPAVYTESAKLTRA